jgi:uncharacterized protein (TIGR00369 family)
MLQRAASLGPALWCGPNRRIRSTRGGEPPGVQLEHGSPFAEQAGLRPVAVEDGRATLTLPAGSSGLTPTGTIHRGAVTVLIEAAATAAALGPDRAPGRQEGTSELYVSFVRGSLEAPLNAEARVVSQAGRRKNCEVEVRDWNGELVAKGFLSCNV